MLEVSVVASSHTCVAYQAQACTWIRAGRERVVLEVTVLGTQQTFTLTQGAQVPDSFVLAD